jgi:hypothetical protein
MEQSQAEIQEQIAKRSPVQDDPAASFLKSSVQTVAPQACSTCGTAPMRVPVDMGSAPAPSYIYAIGSIEARFPNISIEKEVAQATGRSETKGLTNSQALHMVLSKVENRYLLRQLCFVMTIGGLETYLLRPRDLADHDLLAQAIRPNPGPQDLDVVIGMKGPIAPPQLCNGLTLPIVFFDQIYSFDRETLIGAIPKPEGTSAKNYASAAGEVFDHILQMTENAGATDDHRALNYLAVRYQGIYSNYADALARNASLTAVDVMPSVLSGTRNMVDVIFSYTNRTTDVTEKFSCRVDVSDEFPFLVRKMAAYYSR